MSETKPEQATDQTAPTGEPVRFSAEDLVPGLEDEILRQEDETADARLAELETENADLKDRLFRALAEVENIRKRAERDRKDAEAYGGTRLARDLLSVHDNLDRALAAIGDELRETAGPLVTGIEMTQSELLSAFSKHKITPIDPEKGEKFDPNRHQAMFEAPIPGAEPGTVIEVMATGFMISDRLLRPAMVGVAKAAPAPEPAEGT